MKQLRPFRPLLFAILTFLVYLWIYKPPLDTHYAEFITALMTFFAAMGWSSMIICTKEEITIKFSGLPMPLNKKIVFYLYLLLSILSQPTILLLCKGTDVPVHWITYGLFLLAMTGLRFFVTAHQQHQQKK
jgi:hypothetical protein